MRVECRTQGCNAATFSQSVSNVNFWNLRCTGKLKNIFCSCFIQRLCCIAPVLAAQVSGNVSLELTENFN